MRTFAGLTLVFIVSMTGHVVGGEKLEYPKTRTGDTVDDYHGTKVPDPYRWLEDDVRKSSDVRHWVDAQNRVTEHFFKGIPEREEIRKRLTELWNYERYSSPTKMGGYYFFTKNDGLQNQAVLYVQNSLDGEPRVLLDPNTWSKDGTVALSGLSISHDGKRLAYGQSEAGSDWQMWRILNVDSAKTQPDELKWIKFTSIAWTLDNKGFFYSRFDEPAAGQQFQSLNLNQKVFYHRLRTAQADDVLVYKRPDQPEWGFQSHVSEDGRYLILSTFKGTDSRNRVTFKDLTEPYGMVIDLIDSFDNEYSFIENDGPIFYFKTDYEAPRSRVIAIDIRKPDKAHWKELIPQSKDNLSSIGLVGNKFIADYLKDAHTEVKVFNLDGAFQRTIELPGLGTATGFGGRRTDAETFYSFSSFATPPSIFRYDLEKSRSTEFRKSKVKFKPEDYEVDQVFYSSKDGTKVPLFITHKKGLVLDGTNPTLLYGYGGFNISLTPAFSASRIAWLELGGVYAQANLRGGGEYGQDWHKAGTKQHKQNVFDDFIAAAQYLIDKKYTRSDRLAIQGGSNGGLLIGAVMNQRPDLFGACLPAVGVMDMLRFHKFTAGRYWVDDFGSSDNQEEFKALFAYSPYHNIKKGVHYPATLVTTADTDDRVVPGHSFKFIAALQAAQAGDAPVLARIETRAGHGAGKPTSKLIEEVADQWAFLVKNLAIKAKEGAASR